MFGSSEHGGSQLASSRASLWIGLVAALIFVLLTTIRLTAQGLDYDELVAAPAAFDYFGRSPQMSSTAIGNIPLTIETYNGAIKTALYAVYLAFSGQVFSIVSWRLLGIITVAAGFLSFAFLARSRISRGALIAFFALCVTDTTVLSLSRNDYGFAIPFAARMLTLGMFVRMATKGGSWKLLFFIGLLTGFSIYEKLSGVVLLVPLLLAPLLVSKGNRVRGLLLGVAGLLIGLIPLLLANNIWWAEHRTILSLLHVSTAMEVAPLAFFQHIADFLSTASHAGWAAGDLVRPDAHCCFLIGDLPIAESFLMGIIVILLFYLSLRKREKGGTLMRVLLLSYVGIGLALFFLPGPVPLRSHHWILGTPFQYLALGLALGSGPWMQRRFIVLAALLLFFTRVPTVLELEASYDAGSIPHRSFHPSLTTLGELAAKEADRAAFLALDWGLARQIYVLSNGQEDLVYELMKYERIPETFDAISAMQQKRIVYTVQFDIPPLSLEEGTEKLNRAVATLTDWQEVAPAEEWQELAPVIVRKFVRR